MRGTMQDISHRLLAFACVSYGEVFGTLRMEYVHDRRMRCADSLEAVLGPLGRVLDPCTHSPPCTKAEELERELGKSWGKSLRAQREQQIKS